MRDALLQSQNEVESLKQQLSQAVEKAVEAESAYDSLIEQLKQEGSMLNKMDQDRYRKALQELKDYEIYKEVMEATMLKMQSQINDLTADNQVSWKCGSS